MRTIAYCSPFVPAEWIAAHGLHPWRLPLHGAGQNASTTVTRGVCPYVGILIEAVLSEFHADALVLTTACDQMRYAAMLLETRGRCPVFLLNVPSTWQTAAARQLYLDELRRLGRFLTTLGGTAPDAAALTKVMVDLDQTRRCENRAEQNTTNSSDFIPLALVGGPLLDSDQVLFPLVEQAGGRVVLDATENSDRTQPRPFDPVHMAADPLQALAAAYFDGIQDVFRRPNHGLYEWLGRELAARRVQGILFRRYLWCDLWHAELRRLKDLSRLPVLELDVGPDDLSSPNRVQGRIEAFLETLR